MLRNSRHTLQAAAGLSDPPSPFWLLPCVLPIEMSGERELIVLASAEGERGLSRAVAGREREREGETEGQKERGRAAEGRQSEAERALKAF